MIKSYQDMSYIWTTIIMIVIALVFITMFIYRSDEPVYNANSEQEDDNYAVLVACDPETHTIFIPEGWNVVVVTEVNGAEEEEKEK